MFVPCIYVAVCVVGLDVELVMIRECGVVVIVAVAVSGRCHNSGGTSKGKKFGKETSRGM